jgi:hypothetical protein
MECLLVGWFVRRRGFLFPIWEKGVFMLKGFYEGVCSALKSVATAVCGFAQRNALPLVCAGVVGVGVMVGADALLAQGTTTAFTPTPVVFEEIVDWSGIFSTMKTVVAPLVVGAIGIGLAIWGTKFVFRLIKGMAR